MIDEVKFKDWVYLVLCIIILVYIGIFMFVFFDKILIFNNNPDNYYFLNLAMHHIQPAFNIFDYIVYYFGHNAGMILLLICELICAYFIISYSTKSKNQYIYLLSTFYFLFSSLNFFVNSWYGIFDKNAIEQMIFVVFTIITLIIFEENEFEVIMLNQKYSIKWYYVYSIYIFLIYFIGKFFWQGSIYYAILGMIMLTLRYYHETKQKLNTIFILLAFSVIYVFTAPIIPYKKFISEMTLSIPVIVNIEFIVFACLIMFSLWKHRTWIVAYSCLVFGSILIFPRIALFIVPLNIFMLIEIYQAKFENISYALFGILIISSLISAPVYVKAYQHDYFYDLKNDINEKEFIGIPVNNLNMTCNTYNSTIISDWSYGWALRYYYPRCNVLFSGSPEIDSELAYFNHSKEINNSVIIKFNGDDVMLEYYKNLI